MCTVSFYRHDKTVIITSNRDENIHRPSATVPNVQSFGNKKIYYPKDPQAGGTWFAADATGNAFVLLNGAELKHEHSPPYRKSRGLILLEIASSTSPLKCWDTIDLTNIEPFTIVSFVEHELIEMTWDGHQKKKTSKNHLSSFLWASSTLYSPAIQQARKQWFQNFIIEKSRPLTSDNLIHFHTQTQSEDKVNGLVISRNGILLTKNITQFHMEDTQVRMVHLDLVENSKTILSSTAP
jgi:uncharacterized protein with NRDE domain